MRSLGLCSSCFVLRSEAQLTDAKSKEPGTKHNPMAERILFLTGRLAEPALGEIRVSGVFHMHDQAALVAALERGWALRARRVEGGDIVLEPPAG